MIETGYRKITSAEYLGFSRFTGFKASAVDTEDEGYREFTLSSAPVICFLISLNLISVSIF
jgi:hypothetical protein